MSLLYPASADTVLYSDTMPLSQTTHVLILFMQLVAAKIASAKIQVGLAVSKAVCNCRERHSVVHGTAPCRIKMQNVMNTYYTETVFLSRTFVYFYQLGGMAVVTTRKVYPWLLSSLMSSGRASTVA